MAIANQHTRLLISHDGEWIEIDELNDVEEPDIETVYHETNNLSIGWTQRWNTNLHKTKAKKATIDPWDELKYVSHQLLFEYAETKLPVYVQIAPPEGYKVTFQAYINVVRSKFTSGKVQTASVTITPHGEIRRD